MSTLALKWNGIRPVIFGRRVVGGDRCRRGSSRSSLDWSRGVEPSLAGLDAKGHGEGSDLGGFQSSAADSPDAFGGPGRDGRSLLKAQVICRSNDYLPA